ncbi:hypothetical protein K438DRAFT_1815776 [Mycena galopus ATCC 62051]|nr:hypothetical protein K438DRAFT_1818293 [Mycena galopus ATCC 62051]KAF8207145.1 hypothetical protein K438DRAFT_1815776 [Mycena galopus ATCC 62051]
MDVDAPVSKPALPNYSSPCARLFGPAACGECSESEPAPQHFWSDFETSDAGPCFWITGWTSRGCYGSDGRRGPQDNRSCNGAIA